MVLKSKTTGSSTNPLRFSEIEDEFGINSSSTINPGRRSLGNYRVSQSFGKLINQPLDAGIPQSVAIGSSQISFDNFYSKQANVIVDCYTTGSQNCNHDAYINRFAVNKFDVVGGFKTSLPKSDWSGGKKVIIHVNKSFSSFNAVDDNDVALKVGSISDEETNAWPTTTTLSVVIGTEAVIAGKGGNGGRGGYQGNSILQPGNGGNGSSGMKIHSGMSITGIDNDGEIFDSEESFVTGKIIPGGGGGGGGLGLTGIPESDDEPQATCFGGGGGGGAGLPGGEGGISGNNVGNIPGVSGLVNGVHPSARNGAPGNDSDNTEGGSGGLGAKQVTATDESGDPQPGSIATMGKGGDGGDAGQNGGNGANRTNPSWVEEFFSFPGSGDPDSRDGESGTGGLGGSRFITYSQYDFTIYRRT